MPVVIALLLAIAGFIWWSWGRRRAGNAVAGRLDTLFRRRPCRWSETGDRNGVFAEYHCVTCGVAAYSRTGKAPADCKRNLKGGL